MVQLKVKSYNVDLILKNKKGGLGEVSIVIQPRSIFSDIERIYDL